MDYEGRDKMARGAWALSPAAPAPVWGWGLCKAVSPGVLGCSVPDTFTALGGGGEVLIWSLAALRPLCPAPRPRVHTSPRPHRTLKGAK